MSRAFITFSAFAVFLFTAFIDVSGSDTITEIRVKNLGRGALDENLVKAHISARVGDQLDVSATSRDIKALLGAGLFSSVDIYQEPEGDGIRLVYAVRKRAKLAEPVVVEGAEHFRESRIEELLGLVVGDYVDDQLMGVRSARVLAEYRQSHFPYAKATWTLEELDKEQDRVKATYRVDEGARARVVDVVFSGNKAVPADKLAGAMNRPAWWNPFWWMRNRQYDEAEIEAGRSLIRNIYRNKGYLDVKVGPAVLSRTASGDIVLNVNIEEGPLFSYGKVTLTGVDRFPESELRGLDQVKALGAGKNASAEDMGKATQAIRDYYGSRGYVDTMVRAVEETDSASGIDNVKFIVKEGDLAYIKGISILGNTRTRDKVIRRELLVSPGDIFDEVKVRRSEKRINNLGYFSFVRTTHLDTTVASQKDLLLEVEEQSSGRFSCGAGFSSIDRVMIFGEISQGNFDMFNPPYFTGGGQKLKFGTQFASKRKNFDLSFVEPWFLDRKLSLGVDLYSSEVDYDDYNFVKQGGMLSLGKTLGEANRADAGYTLEKLRISDVSDTNEYFNADGGSYFFEREDRISSSLRLSVTRDRRDNSFIPTEGYRLRAFGTVSGGILGFDNDTYGAGGSAVYYHPVFENQVISFRCTYETVEEYGQTQDVPLSDRLFLGGGRSLRGFKYRDVGPKVSRTIKTSDNRDIVYHKPIGGKSLAMATAEYTIPIVPRMMRFAFFYDTGNVWEDPFYVDPGDLASSVGGGLRFDIPLFPIRIDYARVIKKDDELTNTEPWVLWIGYDF